jgi:hypothetical protein
VSPARVGEGLEIAEDRELGLMVTGEPTTLAAQLERSDDRVREVSFVVSDLAPQTWPPAS